MGVTAKKFGNLTSGEEITLYHLENKSGAYAEVMDYGAILVKLCVPDKDGELTDVVLGYDDFPFMDRNTSLTRMRMTIIFTAAPMASRRRFGLLRIQILTKMPLLFPESARMARMDSRENSRCLLHMNLQRTIPCRFTIAESVTRRRWQI